MRLLGCWRFGVCGGGGSLDCNEALKWFKSGVDLQALQTVPGALQGPTIITKSRNSKPYHELSAQRVFLRDCSTTRAFLPSCCFRPFCFILASKPVPRFFWLIVSFCRPFCIFIWIIM